GISGFANNSYDTPINPITVDYSSSRNRAIALGLRYRVVVDVSNSQHTQTLLSIVPDAFRINIGGRSLMQAGAYQDQGEANQLLQVLVSNGLPARIELIR
ncbi:MAG: SPOR domain-containing protein, partial [Microcoleaceae cyanobacterium]